ncbi:MAG: hypothetical protein AAF456_25795, partial [Planctomycetota bacterium]
RQYVYQSSSQIYPSYSSTAQSLLPPFMAAIGDLESDATFAWVRRERGETTGFAYREATTLKIDGEPLYQSRELETGASSR